MAHFHIDLHYTRTWRKLRRAGLRLKLQREWNEIGSNVLLPSHSVSKLFTGSRKAIAWIHTLYIKIYVIFNVLNIITSTKLSKHLLHSVACPGPGKCDFKHYLTFRWPWKPWVMSTTLIWLSVIHKNRESLCSFHHKDHTPWQLLLFPDRTFRVNC